MSATRPFHPDQFENALMDLRASMTIFDIVEEAALPCEDDSELLGLEPSPSLVRFVMTVEVHEAFLHAAMHLRRSVQKVRDLHANGGAAAMMRGFDAGS